ncbi:hypothetical protein L9F63_016904, partial [Diploptera punctata]
KEEIIQDIKEKYITMCALSETKRQEKINSKVKSNNNIQMDVWNRLLREGETRMRLPNLLTTFEIVQRRPSVRTVRFHVIL